MRQDYAIELLQTIADNYPEVRKIQVHEPFTSGFEDTNYYIETGSGKFVIKILENAHLSPAAREFEIEVMDVCNRAGTKTPRVFRNAKGALITSIEGKSSIVMNYIEGELMDYKGFSDQLIGEVGEEIGKIDAALSAFKDGSRAHQDLRFDLKNVLTMESDIALLGPDFDPKIFHEVFAQFDKVRDAFLVLPSGIIHHDAVPRNIIAKDGHLAGIIDFSDVVWAPYAQEVAVSLCELVFGYNWQPQQTRLFLSSYRKFQPFSKAEEALLYDLIAVRYAALVL